jgi:hypothetical protein
MSKKPAAADFKRAIRDLLMIAPTGACEMFHHGKRDLHSWSEPCPPLERYNARLEKARKLISPDKP